MGIPNEEEVKQRWKEMRRWFIPPFSPSNLSALYAADIYAELGLGELDLREAEILGKAVLHTAMNACLKHSKGGGQE